MRGIFKKQKTNKISRKIISGMLTIIMLMGSFSIPTSMNTVKATDGDSNNGGFSVKINWNGTGQTPNLYEYKSETTEYKLVRLKVAYKNNDVENTYAPGQLVITVPGLKNAVRSGNSGTPVAIAADLAAMGTKYYDWNYTYNSKKDTYTFVNNFKIDVHSSFEGSFEIIWNLHSRDTIHNYSQNLSATLRTAHAETTTSDEIKYTQARTRDEYTVSKSASQLYNADGLTDALPDGTTKDQYTWAEYTVRGIDRNKARDVNGAERFDLWFPEGTIVQGGGVVKTENIQTIGGIKYECWSLVKDINYSTLNPYIEGIKVAYPNDKYGGRRVTSYVNIMGTYFDETQEMELAKNALTIDLANYGFMDLPGDIYDDIKQTFGVKNKYVENHCTGDRNCYKYGAISHIHLFNGKQEYTSNFKYTLNYSEKYADYYDIEFVDDFMDVVLKDGSLYQLKDTEYHFTKVEIPSNLNILNLNKIPVAADKYDVEIYIRRAGAEKFEETPFTTVKITSETQTINVPEDTVGVKIIIRRVDECFNIGTFSNVNNGIKVKYVFHVKNPDIRTDSGKHTNLMYTKLYSSRGNEYTWVNNDYGYNTYDNDREYYRDIITYGNSFDREAADIHILEIPNQYHIRNNIVALAESKENYNFTGSMFTNFTLGDGNTLEKFSMYTIIPEGLRLNELYSTPEDLLDILNFSGTNLTSSYIAEHATIEITENYKYSGRQRVAIHFDFSDSPVFTTNISVTNMKMYIPKDKITNTTTLINFYSIAVIDQDEGVWHSTSKDDATFEKGLWSDIDQDNDIQETSSYYLSQINQIKATQSNMQLVKSVKTSLTEGYVQVGLDNEDGYIESEIPKVYQGEEYSYKLRLTTGENNSARNIVFFDNLENGKNAAWQGDFVRVDYKDAEKIMGVAPTIYYSSQVETLKPQPDLSTGNWTTEKPKVVKSIAVDFGDAFLGGEKYLYVEIVLKAPDNVDGGLTDKITENDCSVYYDKWDLDHNELIGSQNLISKYVPVKISLFMGKIELVKKDATNGAALSGAKFDLYKMSGEIPNDNDELIREGLVTNSAGKIIVHVVYGNYYFKETEAPLGYEKSDDPVIVKLNGEKPNLKGLIYVRNQRKDGIFTIRKVSDRNNDVTLQGARFSVYSSDGGLVQNGYDDRYGLVTDVDGELTVKNLSWGDYYLMEVKAPDGYELSEEKYPFTVSADTDAGRLENATIVNKQKPASFELTKYEALEDKTETETTLEGASYTIYKALDDKLMGTYVTDENGQIYIDDLTFGEYYLKEKIAPVGYILNSNDIYFTVSAEHTEVSYKVKAYNTRKTGKVIIKKYDDNGAYVRDAVFGLFNADTREQVGLVGGNLGIGFTTDNEGVIEIKGLYWGKYYLKEIEAPTGYELNNTEYPFTISANTVSNRLIIDIVNERQKGSILLTKVDEKNEDTTLGGAVFTLYRSDGTIYLDDLVTGDDGKLLVKEIEWGSYYFLEKEAPEGYGLNPDKIRFAVNYLTAGKTQELIVTDPQVTGEIKIIKRIKISDIVFAHGNPTFIFKVENDKTGQTYYKSITFSEEYVEDFIEKNPSEKYIEQSVTLSGLPVGKYRISEVDTLRYTRAPEYIVTPYEVKDDDNVVTLTYSDLKLETKFTNIKEKQSSTTHTAQLTNILKRDRKLTAVVAVWRGPKIVETETLETSSLDVYAVYDDGNQVKLNSDEYELDPETFDPSMNGERSVKVTYEEEGIVRSDTFIITIKVSLPFTWEKVVEYETPIVGDDGVKYYGEVTVTGYLGSSTIIDIPSKVDGIRETEDTHIDKGKTYKVTGVGDENGRNTTNSFIYKDEDLNGVTIRIPNGIKIIYGYAFAGDERITGIQFPDSLEEIEVSAFNMSGLIGELKLPPNLKTIGSYAFKGCGFTGTLTLGNSLETISIGAFVECKFTGNLVIPDTVKTINSYAFDNGGNSRKAFEGGILSLPNNAEFKTIGWNTFRNCGFIGDLVIPDSVEIIEGNAFHRCTFKGKLTLGSNLKTVGYQSFYLCGFNGSLNIPDLVIDIGDQAFAGVAGFSSLTFGSKVKTIGSNSFASTGITSLSIPNTVTEIRANAFGNCTSLGGTVRIPNSVTVLGNAVFLYCINLAEVQLPSRLAPYEPGYARITVTYYD